MFLKKLFVIIAVLSASVSGAQNVGIGNGAVLPDASAMLDIQSDSKGLLIPRLSTAQRNAIVSPATGLLIFQVDGTAGFYFNSGTPVSPNWLPLSVTDNWSLTGNSGTNPANHFIGTTDGTNFLIKTNNVERVRFGFNGQTLINGSAYQNGSEVFTVIGSGVTGAIAGLPYPINGYSSGVNSAIYGTNSGAGQGVLGVSTGTGTGVYGLNSNNGIGVFGQSTANAGVRGTTSHLSSAGVHGANTNTNGTGVIALGNNITTASSYSAGAGLTANGRGVGTYSAGINTTDGIGVVGLGNNMTSFNNFAQGTGVLGQGENFGVMAYASSVGTAVANNKWAGYFDYLPSANGFAYIGGRTNGTDYGILSTGVKSTMIKDEDNRNRIMYCTEAPEVLFQDFGSAQLVNGKAHITIDPILARNIFVSDNKPMKVFIQLEGDCKGVFVTNKTANGFDVVELQGGTSNTAFSYQIIANRADVKDENDRVVSRYSDVRLPVGPERAEGKREKAVEVKAEAMEEPERLRR